ncbi:hypothetical protein PAMP_002055 [Pampus punctatissimus]
MGQRRGTMIAYMTLLKMAENLWLVPIGAKRGAECASLLLAVHSLSIAKTHVVPPCGIVTGYFAVPGKTTGDLGAAVGPRDVVSRPTTGGYPSTTAPVGK